MNRNNRMYSLEKHDIHTYGFESTSQIIELVLLKLVCFVRKFYIFTLFKYRNISLNHDIFKAMHRYFQLLHRPISNME